MTTMKERLDAHLNEFVVVNLKGELSEHPIWRRHAWGKLRRNDDGTYRVHGETFTPKKVIGLLPLSFDDVEELGLDGTLRS